MSNNGPDICSRCGGNMLVQKWKGEGSCLQCGNWYYGNGHKGNGNGNGHGHHSSALLIQTASYLVTEEPLSTTNEPSDRADDSPIFKTFSQIFKRCAASNGGCKHCRVMRKCQALYDRGGRIEGQGQFNLHYYRIFTQKAQNLLLTP